MAVALDPPDRMPGPWYRQVGPDAWRAFWATFLGWVLDGFDFTILTFVLVDIQQSFTVDAALAGALGTVTLLFRLIGGVAAGAAADRWGRKLPLMLSILWFSLFAFLSGFSTSYAMLFAFRALFGIGMGGEWAAGMPLAIEHWPKHLRGVASGLLQGGFYWGYVLAAVVFQFVYPAFAGMPGVGWRVMFWIGVLPALLVLWVRTGVTESPVWLARAHARRAGQVEARVPIAAIFQRDLLPTTLHTSVLIGTFMVSYYSSTYWYATLLRERAAAPLFYIVVLNLGAIVGMPLWGRLSETRVGRRGAISLAAALGVLAIPAFVFTESPQAMLAGALLMGATGLGVWGLAPSYLTERYPTDVRGVGPGFSYHMGAAIGALTPTLIGGLRDAGTPLSSAMALFIAASSVACGLVVWLGPETRGRELG